MSQIPLAFYVLRQRELWPDKLHSHTPVSTLLAKISAGYFLHDLGFCLATGEGWPYTLHAACCASVYMYAACFGVMHYYGGPPLHPFLPPERAGCVLCLWNHAEVEIGLNNRLHERVLGRFSSRFLLTLYPPPPPPPPPEAFAQSPSCRASEKAFR